MSKGKILVAEDNVMNQKVIQALLRKEGYDVTLVANGKLALEVLEQQEFISLILDYQMPELDGLEALQIIRNRNSGKNWNIPVVFLTAELNQEVLRQIEQLGVSHLLEKPIVPDKLIEAVTLLKNRSLEAACPNDKPNTDYLHAITDGNKKLMAELIQIFVEEAPVAIQKMKAAYEIGDYAALLQVIHKIKPNFKYVGMQKGEKLLNDLEKNLENNPEPNAYLSQINFLEQVILNFLPDLILEKQLLQENN